MYKPAPLRRYVECLDQFFVCSPYMPHAQSLHTLLDKVTQPSMRRSKFNQYLLNNYKYSPKAQKLLRENKPARAKTIHLSAQLPCPVSLWSCLRTSLKVNLSNGFYMAICVVVVVVTFVYGKG